MADRGHELTEDALKALEKRIAKEYRTATTEARQKLEAYLKETEEKRKIQADLLNKGKITVKEYNDWCYRHIMTGKRWEQMSDSLARDFHNAKEIAKKISYDTMPDIYALNMNFGTYQLEQSGHIDTGFTLYNHDTAEYLLQSDREMMPPPSPKKKREIEANKDLQWNKKHIQSAVLQGVLQGESPYDVAKRLRSVGQMDYNASVRYARTMTTNVQNAGRYRAFERAKSLGVDLTIEWQATLDNRTRHEHRMMHGQRRDVGEPFTVTEADGTTFEILWPAQTKFDGTDIPQNTIWNCRCTLLSWVKGFEGDTVKSSPKMDESFEEWQEEKEAQKEPKKPEAPAPEPAPVEPEETAPEPVQEPAISPEEQEKIDEERQKLLDSSQLLKRLDSAKVDYNDPKKLAKIPTGNEIVHKISGDDQTAGSCVSLSLAYAGNKAGFEVYDFRGGNSQTVFANGWFGGELFRRLGVEEVGRTEVGCAKKLLQTMKEGKEYILTAGKHASVVRRVGDAFEYLELQQKADKREDGWHGIGENTLKNRFGCRKTPRRSPWTGKTEDSKAMLLDIDSLFGDPVFERVLGYINTDPKKQKAGWGGYAK